MSERWFLRLEGPLKYLPAVLGVVLAALVSSAIVQITHPFISHDDWDSILPPTPERTDLLFNRQLAEGRWLNYLWWRGGSYHLTPVTATLIYFGAYGLFIVRLSQRLRAGWWSLLVAAALFVSPMVAEAAYWPAILGPSMLVLAVSMWLLPLCDHRVSWLLVWMVGSTLLAMLTYQPVAMLVFLVLMLEERHRPLRQLTGLAIAFCVAWAGSVLVTFTLNWFAYGTFGVKAQLWRKPNELESLADLAQNLGVVGTHFRIVFESTPVPIVVGILALAACLVAKSLRPSGILLLLSVLLMAVLESLTTIQAGFLTPYRSSMWVWVVIVVAILWLTELPYRYASLISAAALGLVIVCGGLYWHQSVSDHQRQLAEYDEISWRVQRLVQTTGKTKAAIIGSTDDWNYYVFTQQAAYLRSRTDFETGILPRNCRPKLCGLARDPKVIDKKADVFVRGDYIVIRPPASEWGS